MRDTAGGRSILGTSSSQAEHKLEVTSRGGVTPVGLLLATWGPPLGVALAFALSLLIRFPAFTWPLNQQPSAPCCGHPDEWTHYMISRSFAGYAHRINYPPGLGYMTHLAGKAGVGRLAASLAPPDAGGEQLAHIRGVYTMRLLVLLFSGAGVWLLYLLGQTAGLSRWVSACAAAFLAFSPLFLVYSIFGLADVPTTVLVLAYVYCYLRWSETDRLRFLVGFALLVGAALAVKLGVVIAIPLGLHVLLTSHRRMAHATILLAGTVAGAFLVSGGSPSVGELAGIAGFVTASVRPTKASLPWNAVHHLGSLVPGMGVLFVGVLMASILGWRAWVRDARRAGWRATLATPWGAVAAGCLLSLYTVVQASSIHTRQLLVVYPFLVIFAMAGISRLGPVRRFLEPPSEGSQRRANLAGAAAVALITAYGVMASRPVLASFTDDPNVRAARWLNSHGDSDDCVEFTRYTELAKHLHHRMPARAGDGRTRDLVVIHSYWFGRFTGSWSLKPAPKALNQVKGRHAKDERVLRGWQALLEGRLTGLTTVATFGDEWWTPERAFLSLVGRGYDQFMTAGQVLIVERERVDGGDLIPGTPIPVPARGC